MDGTPSNGSQSQAAHRALDDERLLESNVLIIDDEHSNVLLLERILAREKFKSVRSTTDPRRALLLFQESQPDLVLTDLAMPEMDGFAVMEALRGLVNGATFLPIIVLTADITMLTKRRALAAGATDFLTKPFDNLEVVLRIKNHLRARLLHRAIEECNATLEQAVAERTHELREALVKLELAQQHLVQHERLSALGTMASGIAHDFNNILSVITGFGEILLSDIPKEKVEAHEALGIMLAAADDGAKIVHRLRDFQRPLSSDDVRVPVDLNELIEQTVKLTRPRWNDQPKARGITVRIDLELGQIPLLLGLSAELRDLLMNLIFNAVDAMPDGGTITIRTGTEPGGVMLQISDTGTGMSEETRQRCLEPFFTTKGERGTGMGLAMVYGIIQRHKGTLELESEPGKGTTFMIHLHDGEEKTIAKIAAEAPLNPVRLLNILVVDDEPVLCHLLCEYLAEDFHTVEVAANAAEALEKFRAGDFDVVITDHKMPGMSGDELAQALKAMNPEQPVIMLTGYASETEKVSEVADFVASKPISLGTLRNALARVMTAH